MIRRIEKINRPLHFETYVSLTCHNCPDVVQALNIMSVLNPNISHTMIEGGMFKEEVDAKKVMAVPTVFLDGEEFASGRMSIEQLVDLAAGGGVNSRVIPSKPASNNTAIAKYGLAAGSTERNSKRVDKPRDSAPMPAWWQRSTKRIKSRGWP